MALRERREEKRGESVHADEHEGQEESLTGEGAGRSEKKKKKKERKKKENKGGGQEENELATNN